MKSLLIVGCLLLFVNAAFAETVPVVRVDTENSWATLGRLYVILATTDNDEPHGKIAAANSNTMERLFRTHVAQNAVTVLKIPPHNLHRQTVLSLIANLPIRSEDAVVFYYSGKGYIDRRLGQYFELPVVEEELYRSEVRAAILAKNPRLCVLLSDFSDPVAGIAHQHDPSNEPPSAGVPATAPLFFELFFINWGIIDINSSESGQVSCANENGIGYLTDALAGLLAVNRQKILSWRRVFPYVQADTSTAFVKSFPDGADIGEGRRQNTQTPVLLQFGDNIVDEATWSRIYPPNADPSASIISTADDERREADRRIVSQLVQQAAGELRPFDAADRGTHENFKALDVDNTFLGRDGEPFSTRIPPVAIAGVENNEGENPARVGAAEEQQDAAPPVRLGIQAASNQGDGVRITRVREGYPGDNAGLRVGEVILVIGDKRITSEQDYSEAIDTATDQLEMRVRSINGGTPRRVTVHLTSAPVE